MEENNNVLEILTNQKIDNPILDQEPIEDAKIQEEQDLDKQEDTPLPLHPISPQKPIKKIQRKKYPEFLYNCNNCDFKTNQKHKFISHLTKKIKCDENRNNEWLIKNQIEQYQELLDLYKKDKVNLGDTERVKRYKILHKRLDTIQKLFRDDNADIIDKTRRELNDLG